MTRLPLTLLAWSALSACGPVTYVQVSTQAEALEQTAVGQALLAAAPIDGREADVRFTLGTSGGLGTLPGSTEGGIPLHTQGIGVAGELAFILGPVELGLVTGGAGSEALSMGSGLRHGGLRLRGAPGTDHIRINVVGEAGLRFVGARQGTSVLCDVVPNLANNGWVRAEDGDCWTNRARAGRFDWSLVPSLSFSVYPAFEVMPGLWVFGGWTVDQVIESYRADELWEVNRDGLGRKAEQDTWYERQMVGLWLAGVDVRLHQHLALLANVRGVAFGPDLGAPRAELAVSFPF